MISDLIWVFKKYMSLLELDKKKVISNEMLFCIHDFFVFLIWIFYCEVPFNKHIRTSQLCQWWGWVLLFSRHSEEEYDWFKKHTAGNVLHCQICHPLTGPLQHSSMVCYCGMWPWCLNWESFGLAYANSVPPPLSNKSMAMPVSNQCVAMCDFCIWFPCMFA